MLLGKFELMGLQPIPWLSEEKEDKLSSKENYALIVLECSRKKALQAQRSGGEYG